MFKFLRAIFGTAQDRKVRRYRHMVREIRALEEKLKPLSDDQLRAKTLEFKERYRSGESLDALLPEAYAVVVEACRRFCGTEVHVSGYDQKWDMIPYDVQLVGAIAMYHGNIAEMMTGEGKTLTAILPLYLNALSGRPVHLVTVNDYLAERDCQWVGSILRWLGLTTGALTSATPTQARKDLYRCDVLYGTASEFGFDYLRDNSMAMRAEEQVQSGHYFVIIDEIDSILIDEARTPLIISGPSNRSYQKYAELHPGVAALVRLQRDYCNKLASEVRKEINIPQDQEGIQFTKEERARLEPAFRKLWLVSKGMPNNRTLKRLREEPEIRAELDQVDLYFHGDQNKEERHEFLAELYIIVDERANEYELTDKGIIAWENCAPSDIKSEAFTMLDLSHEYIQIDGDSSLSDSEKMQRKLEVQAEDAERKEIAHNLRQLLRAQLLMECDVDYIIQEGKIVIIDEHTGRAQPGRRFSDGLHQAIEAKEGVKIQEETQTYATITLQNYFRMYEKRSGMTGTAMTEANEFKEIYKLDVLEIPTHRPCIRVDHNDEIYMTEREKYAAILKEVREIHEKGRPILLGTETVEVSEKLSRIFRQNDLPHTVLNAKYHEKEAEIVAEAGRRGAITIATNMAGRGTDIKLENGVADLGGLAVIGTARHQSRRIDRQLRGRGARQGDPGTAKFFLSMEDQLLRLFTSPKMTALLLRLRPPEGEPISASILNKSVSTAQKRVEQKNYAIRKHTLEYDDVMNKQRQAIYAFRNEILHTPSPIDIAHEMIEEVCAFGAESFFHSHGEAGGWDAEGYAEWLMEHFPISFEAEDFDDERADIQDLIKIASDKVVSFFDHSIEQKSSQIRALEKEKLIGEGTLNYILRDIMLRRLDRHWKEHLLTMDHLRTEMVMRQVGQRDPLMEFKHEAFKQFDALHREIRAEIAQAIFKFEISLPEREAIDQVIRSMHFETQRNFLAEDRTAPVEEAEQERASEPVGREPVFEQEPPRNAACPCGSGKKYKACCGRAELVEGKNSR